MERGQRTRLEADKDHVRKTVLKVLCMLETSQFSERTGEVGQLFSAIFSLMGNVTIGQRPRTTVTV